jgi:hypothetical protein
MAYRRFPLALMAAGLLLIPACKSGPPSSGSPSGKDEAALVERKVEYLEGLLARRGEAGHALAALTSALPGRVWLTEVAYDDAGKIQVKGMAATNNLLADYVTRLGENPSFTNMALGGSVMKTVRGREAQEFTFEIALLEAAPEAAPAGASPADRLKDLEKNVPARRDIAGMLRELQSLALDAGLQMTKFAPGAEVSGEFTAELPVAIEVAGGLRSLCRYLDGLAELPSLWVVNRLSVRAVAPDDPRSQVRAAVSARGQFAR